ncbi:MAG: hypothetical protein IKH82_08780 [Clostridiales bacterium]|nr:hypothetical protein [Clostridiales bacterium]MBR6988150.1 hypothetical protein [Clostridiales bacterium]
MAFTIKIYEKNEYLYSLLKKRLISFYPDAYIVNPYLDRQDYADRFSTFTRVIYDPADINISDIPHSTTSPIRLTEGSGIIDCSRLIQMLKNEEDSPVGIRPVSGSMYAVLPFVYSDERERFISELSGELSGADFNIRLDFTSKIRAMWKGSVRSNMTSLLEACRSKKFAPEDILKYCNMDDYGFLTPGSTTNCDDIYDAGIERSKTLISHAANLAHSNNRLVNVLTVIEGFRTKDLPELLCSCDKVSILLPAQSSEEGIGASELITMLTQTLGRERVYVYYANKPSDSDNPEDDIDNRRLVV